MKQHTLSIIMLLFLVYSCKVNKTEEKTENPLLAEAEISSEKSSCYYSEKMIGENSSDTSQVKLIGLYENLKINGESTNGYTLVLWVLDSEILGFFNVYEGDVEPTRKGVITQGTMTNNSLNLNIWTHLNGYGALDKSDTIMYSFYLEKSENKLIGSYTTHNCSEESNNLKNNEKIELISSDMWKFKDYNNIKEWKQEFSYALDY